MMSEPSQPTWWDFLKWAYLTLRREQKNYESNRSWTLERIQKGWHPDLRSPLFIIGAPRSGTTFLGRCIGALPSVSYHFEPMATKSATKYVYRNVWTEKEAQSFYKFVYRSLIRWQLDGDIRFAEKTPRNCFIVPFLDRTFPDAKFIHIIRDGRDTSLSHSKKSWLRARCKSSILNTGSYEFGVYPRFWVEKERREEFKNTSVLHRCIWAWRRHVEEALKALDDVPRERCFHLRYEKFVRHPHCKADKLLDFLQIEEASQRDALHAVAEEAHQNSIGSWEDELTPEQLDRIQGEAGHLLRRLGYDTETPAVSL